MAKILVVEDDPDLQKEIASWLADEQHLVEATADGADAYAFLSAYKYDLVILDWQLPGLCGLDIVKRLRDAGDKTPVIMLTGMSSVDHKTAGLDSGADDYLVKPFHFRELMARVRVALRHSAGLTSNTIKVGAISLEPKQRIVSVAGTEVQLQRKEFALLEFLMRNEGSVFDADALLTRVWASDSEATANTVKSCMYTLRKKLSLVGCDSMIQTVHGSGYKLLSKSQ